MKDNLTPVTKKLKTLPSFWDGKNAIIEMKKAKYSHWKQMEWMGFYFQFLCHKNLDRVLKIPGPRFQRVEFDGFYKVPWDFKAHAINTSNHQIIVNDREAVENAIKKHGWVGLILALGEVGYNDRKRTFQKWHEKLKGGKSAFEIERVDRGAWSRLRKVSFTLEQILLIKIDKTTLNKSGSFQANFRNADGSPRRSKVLINLEDLGEKEVIATINFK